MIDPILQIALTKFGLSILLALLAWCAQRVWNRPQFTHVLWLLVLVTMLTPALFTIRLLHVPALATSVAELSALAEIDGQAGAPNYLSGFFSAVAARLDLIWLCGSAIVLCWSLVRVFRFNRSLIAASRPAPRELARTASEIAASLGLHFVPSIRITDASVSPLVWWLGGRPRVVIPATLAAELSSEQLRWMLAHEFAHIRRRDHVVRWVEWIACVLFWWNPVTWWARRSLRAAEEMCCDSLALNASGANPRGYARSLLAVVDFLALPTAIRPPVLAISAAGGERTTNLERRIRMIISSKSGAQMSRRGRTALWVLAAVVLSLGLLNFGTTAAQIQPSQEKPARQTQEKPRPSALQRCEAMIQEIRAAVAGGSMTEEEAKVHISQCDTERQATLAEMEIRKAIESGAITPAEGKEKLAAVYQGRAFISSNEKRASAAEDNAKLAEAELALRRAVEAGTISIEEAKAKLAALKQPKPKPTGGEMNKADCDKLARIIAESVAAGLITFEQGREKYAAGCGK